MVDVAHDGDHRRPVPEVVVVLVLVEGRRLASRVLDAFLLLVDPLDALRLGDGDDRLLVQHLAHLHGDALHEEHLDHLRLRRRQVLAQPIHVHPDGRDLEDLDGDGLVSLGGLAALRGARRLAAAPARHLIGSGGVGEGRPGPAAAAALVPPGVGASAPLGRVGAKVLGPRVRPAAAAAAAVAKGAVAAVAAATAAAAAEPGARRRDRDRRSRRVRPPPIPLPPPRPPSNFCRRRDRRRDRRRGPGGARRPRRARRCGRACRSRRGRIGSCAASPPWRA